MHTNKTGFLSLLLAGALLGLPACGGPSEDANNNIAQANARVDEVLNRLNKIENDSLSGAIKQISLAVEGRKFLINARLALKMIDQTTASNALQQLAQQAGQIPTTFSAAQVTLTSVLTNIKDDAKATYDATMLGPTGSTITDQVCENDLYPFIKGTYDYQDGLGEWTMGALVSAVKSANGKYCALNASQLTPGVVELSGIKPMSFEIKVGSSYWPFKRVLQ